jgi:anaerobic selenocysteine-containing dehydrogenase
MRAYVDSGKLVSVEGIPNHLISRGGLCAKGLSAVEYEYDLKRLTKPLERKGERGEGKWEEVSWDNALDIITSKLKQFKAEYGARSIVWHRGSAPGWGTNWDLVKRFMNVFGSPNVASTDQLCHTPREIGHMYTYGLLPVADYENAKLIILWGFNPVNTALPSIGRAVIDAVERGSKLIVVDPRFTTIASKADIFVQLRPGTDGALALGILNYIIEENLYDKEFVEKWGYGFDELKAFVEKYTPAKVSQITWVPEDQIRAVANLYATIRPAVLESQNGIDQHTNVTQTARAIAILQAITGNLDTTGGHVFLSYLPTRDLRLKEKLQEILKHTQSISIHPLFYAPKGVSTPDLLDAIETDKPYQIKALIVQGSGIIGVASNEGKVRETLKKLDFIAVHDQYMTAAAEIADIILPAATFLEYTHIRTENGFPDTNAYTLTLSNKVVEPLGECWSDPKFIFELARKLGYEEYFPWKSEEELVDYELEPLGLTIDELKKHPEGMPITSDRNKIKYEKAGFRTPTGKVEFYSETFEKLGYSPLPEFKEPAESPLSRPDLVKEYPLICGTGLKLQQFTQTRFRTLPSLSEMHPHTFVEIHPETAKGLGIAEDDWIFVESQRGRIRAEAKFSLRVHPKVVIVAHGWGQPYAHGQSANTLTDDKARCPISSATGNRSFLCKVYKE